MRTLHSGSFERISSREAMWTAYGKCRRGKSRQIGMSRFHLDADTHVLALHRELVAGSYAPAAHRLRVIRDPKVRSIAAPAIRDRIVHRAVVDEIGPHFERGFREEHFAWGSGRGPHRAVLAFLRCSRRYGYRLRLDVASYFASVDHERLERLLFARIRDSCTRALIARLVRHQGSVYELPVAREIYGERAQRGRGIGLGSYLSQWCGAFYLNAFDHFVKRELRVPGYVRYMDDFVLFDREPGTLEEAWRRIEEWLAVERGLELNPKSGPVESTTQPAVFLGYRVNQAGISPSRKLRRRFRAQVRAAAARRPEQLERTVAAYRGLLCF